MHSPKSFGSADARGVPSAVGKLLTALSLDGQPGALYALFFVEMGERFGFYLVAALMALFLDEQRHWKQERIALTCGLFVGATYLTPLVGGLLADWGLGKRRAVLLGTVVLAVGYVLLACGWLLFALAVLVVGSGLFKPSITSMVGNLYAPGDERRDRGFAIFYLGINAGALAAPFCGEWLRASWGYSAAFAAAAAAMVLSMLVLVTRWEQLARCELYSPLLLLQDLRPAKQRSPLSADEKVRVQVLLVLAAVLVFFWVAFQQSSCALTFWAQKSTDRAVHALWLQRLLGRAEIPTVWFSSLSAIFVVLLSPVMVRLWSRMKQRGKEPSTPTKILLGMLLTALAYAVMVLAALVGGADGKGSMVWLTGCYLMISGAELCLSPMGLSMVSKLAPRSLQGVMMGVWFLATFVGNTLAGIIGMLWPRWSHAHFFLLLVATSLGSAGLLWLQRRRLAVALGTAPSSHGASTDHTQRVV